MHVLSTEWWSPPRPAVHWRITGKEGFDRAISTTWRIEDEELGLKEVRCRRRVVMYSVAVADEGTPPPLGNKLAETERAVLRDSTLW